MIPTSPLTTRRFFAVEQARSPPPRRMFSAVAVLSLGYLPGHFQSRLLGDVKTGARQKQQEWNTPRQWPLGTGASFVYVHEKTSDYHC